MAPLLLALLVLFGGLADPEPQRDADDYPVQVALWQIITSRMVDLVDEVVTRDEVWGVVVAPPGRQEWWDRITALADSAPRPTPSDGPTSLNQEYYSAAVAPIRAGLNSLAMAMRTAILGVRAGAHPPPPPPPTRPAGRRGRNVVVIRPPGTRAPPRGALPAGAGPPAAPGG